MAASFNGLEVTIHSSSLSSLEDVEIAEAKLLTGHLERAIQTKSCDVHTSPLGYTCDLVDDNSANQNNATDNTKAANEAANMDIDRRLANLGFNNQSCIDLAQSQAEVHDNNCQHTSLAELSFRIDCPGDLDSEFRSLDASSNSLFGKGTDSKANLGANKCAGERQAEMSILQCTSEMSLREKIPAANSTPFSQIDESMDRIVNNKAAVSRDSIVYTPHLNNPVAKEARELHYANADCVDGKVMKIGGIEVRRSNLSMQSNGPRISSLPKRDCQSQGFSSTSNFESAKASSEDKHAIELERSITYPRTFQVRKVSEAQIQEKEEFVDYEDLYLPQRMLPIHRQKYKTPFHSSDPQKVSCLEEEELYPVLFNDQLVRRQDTIGGSLPFQSDLPSYEADWNKAMKEHLQYQVSSAQLSSPNANGSQNPYAEAVGYFIDPYDYSAAPLAGPHEHPQARFQDFRCHSNQQCPIDLCYPQLPSGAGASASPISLHQFTTPSFDSQNDISSHVTVNSVPYANTCCHHICMQLPSHMPSSGNLHSCTPTLAHHSQMSYQSWHSEDQYLQHNTYRNLPQRGLYRQQLHGGTHRISECQSHMCLTRKKNWPPLPGPGAPPYVLCQVCNKVLQVPANLHNGIPFQRIRCGACGRASKFFNVLHPHSQSLLVDASAAGCAQEDYDNSFLNKHGPHATATIMGLSEQVFANDAKKAPMPATLVNRSLRSSCGFRGQYDGVDKYPSIAKCHPRLTATMSLKQQPCENGWRYATDHRFSDSSGKVCSSNPSYLPIIVNGSGGLGNAALHPLNKMQQSKARVDSVSKHVDFGQGKEAFEAPRVADDFIRERSYSRVRMSSGEIQGLHLGCPQEGSLLVGQIDSHSLQQGHGNGVVNNSINGASCSPASGSLLHEHLSCDAAPESDERDCKPEEKSKQAGADPSAQDVSKGSKFLSGLLKKNIRELGRGQRSNKNWKVVVNGQMLPYAAVKSAEKLAGTICPGIYWYDYQAGFWGLIGGPCLGVIPPFIAEFNFPLAKECAGGTTGVFVNGRELHKKDLDVLCGRGLPKTRGKAYMVDISGQVIDQASGQLLRSLGRLAPTIERRGRGCGMFQPPSQL